MADNLLDDIIDGVVSWLATNLSTVTAEEIVVARPDDRIAGDDERELHKVAVSIIDFPFDRENRYSGKFCDYEIDQADIDAYLADPDTAPIPAAIQRRSPLPFRLFFQVDTWCRTKAESWPIKLDMKALLASEMKIVTAAEKEFHPRVEPGDDQDDLMPEGFRSVYRFSIPVWLDNPHQLANVALVVKAIFEINNQLTEVEA